MHGGRWVAVALLVVGACTSGEDGATVDRLVVLDRDGNVSTIRPDGSDSVALTSDAGDGVDYTHPTWSPTAERVAFTRARPPAGAALMTVPADATGEPAAAETPSPPFFIHWSPDGDRLAFLADGAAGLDLRLVDVAEDATAARTLATGSPLYLAWAADGSGLLTHTGTGDDATLARQPTDGPATTLPDRPGTFQAPQWGRDDDLIYAVNGDVDQRLVVADPDGNLRTEVAHFTGVVAFTLDPTGRRLAFTVHDPGRDDDATVEVAFRGGQEDGTAPANALVIADLDSGAHERVADGPVLAQQWSPTGEALLFATLARTDADAALRWHVWDGDRVVAFEPVRPTATFAREYLPFFDQYSRSLTLWSPRGDAFAYAARDDDGDGIWVQPVGEAGRSPWRVTDGRSVSWSPR